jgi:hypothetical protein
LFPDLFPGDASDMTVNLAEPSRIGGFFIVFRAASPLNDVTVDVFEAGEVEFVVEVPVCGDC